MQGLPSSEPAGLRGIQEDGAPERRGFYRLEGTHSPCAACASQDRQVPAERFVKCPMAAGLSAGGVGLIRETKLRVFQGYTMVATGGVRGASSGFPGSSELRNFLIHHSRFESEASNCSRCRPRTKSSCGSELAIAKLERPMARD